MEFTRATFMHDQPSKSWKIAALSRYSLWTHTCSEAPAATHHAIIPAGAAVAERSASTELVSECILNNIPVWKFGIDRDTPDTPTVV